MNTNEYLSQIGMEIKIARTRKKITTRELAKSTGLNAGTINAIERGGREAKILTYKKIADALEMDMKAFV